MTDKIHTAGPRETLFARASFPRVIFSCFHVPFAAETFLGFMRRL